MRRGRRTLLLALLLAVATPASAGADSIAYIKDSNVWIAKPDGTAAYQVTLDGTADKPYSAPSQADDGTLLAIKGSGTAAQFHHLRQNGDLIDPPFDHAAPAHPHDAQLSPDGRLVAYHWVGLTNSCHPSSCVAGNPRTFVSYSNRFTPGEEITNAVNFQNPSWMGNGRLFLSYGASLTFTYDLGNEDASQWFADGNTTVTDPDLDATNSRIVVIGERDSGRPETLRFFETNGPPPAAPTLMPCYLTDPIGGSFDDPTFAPDGNALAWAEGDGIWRATLGTYDSVDCADFLTAGGLLIPGGSEPDWGPADVNPGPRTTVPTGGGGSTGAGTTGGGTTGGGTAPSAPPAAGPAEAPAAFRFAVLGRPSLRTFLKSGLRVSMECPGPCEVRGVLSYRGKRIGTWRKTLLSAGTTSAVVRAARAGKRTLRRPERARLTLKVDVRDSAGKTSTFTRSVSLRR